MSSVDRRLADLVEIKKQLAELNIGVENATSVDMDTVDAKIAAAEARSDTKFAELRGDFGRDFAEIRGEFSRDFAEIKTALAHMPSTLTIWGAVFTGAVAIIGILLATLAFGGDRFDGGVSVGGIVAQVQQDQKRRDDAQDAKLDEILKRLPAQK